MSFGCRQFFLVQYVRKNYFKGFLLTLVFSSFCTLAKDKVENLDLESIPLYIGVQYDYELAPELKGKDLKFEGTYTRHTSLKYNKAKGLLRFKPRRKGIGVINIKDNAGKILEKLAVNIRKTDLREMANEVKFLLRTIDGINVKILNNKVVVDGEIVVPRDMRRIHAVVQEYNGKGGGVATSLVTLSPIAWSKVAKFMEKEINDPNITVRAANEVFILEGFVDKPEDSKRAMDIATLYLPDHIVDLAVVEAKVKEYQYKPIINHIVVRASKKDTEADANRQKLIQIIVHYVELNKDYENSFRFQWMPAVGEDGTKVTLSAGGGGGLGRLSGIIAGTVHNFLPKLNWAKTFGFARILHSANITIENKKTATISSTKNLPSAVPIADSGGQRAGGNSNETVDLKITPAIIGKMKDSVRLKIDNFTVSQMIGMKYGQPVTTRRTVTTTVHVQNGLSAVLGGMISNRAFSDYNRPPDKATGSPLFSFLSAKSFNRAQNQFIVFITPVIKSSASSGVNRIKKKFKISGS